MAYRKIRTEEKKYQAQAVFFPRTFKTLPNSALRELIALAISESCDIAEAQS
jgi:hypothetical protein